MVLVVDAAHGAAIAATLRAAGETVYEIGAIAAQQAGAARVIVA
jgi:phosphoribosylformylglycinamidine cyclo-ligase